MEEEVRGDGRVGSSASQAIGGGLKPGQTHVAGDRPKKALRPARKRELAKDLMESYRVSRRRACRIVELWPRTMRYESVKDPQDGLRIRLKDFGREPGAVRIPASARVAIA
jgi:hypothetical protein